nr:MAG TPA: hypothetical protein [Caudoviricetes sp.]
MVDSGSEGRGFESHPGHKRISKCWKSFFYGVTRKLFFFIYVL